MRSIRLYVDLPLGATEMLALPEPAARHAVKVMRLCVGDPVTLFNGDGKDYPAQLVQIGGGVQVALGPGVPVASESPWSITLAQALARGEKMDLVVQKATELGVAEIMPLITERSEVRLDDKRAARRGERWQTIARSACEQCGRARIPVIHAPLPLTDWLREQAERAATRWALIPQAGHRIRELSPTPDVPIVLVVGPEGGLGEQDVRSLQAAGFVGLRLGPRILRTETAGLAALAAIAAVHGDI